MLSNLAISDFQNLYKKHFGIELTELEANEIGMEILNFFKLIYRPIPKAHSWVTEPIVPVYEIL